MNAATIHPAPTPSVDWQSTRAEFLAGQAEVIAQLAESRRRFYGVAAEMLADDEHVGMIRSKLYAVIDDLAERAGAAHPDLDYRVAMWLDDVEDAIAGRPFAAGRQWGSDEYLGGIAAKLFWLASVLRLPDDEVRGDLMRLCGAASLEAIPSTESHHDRD